MLTRATQSGCLMLAPAKINVSLEVLSRRADGFHELRTVMSALRLFDTLHVHCQRSPSPNLPRIETDRVACDFDVRLATPGLEMPPLGPDNLVMRAFDRLAEATGQRLEGAVRLVKRIPSQAGLGGGSSDAAAALVAGNRAWGLGLSADRLMELGGSLGSDVPFFVDLSAHGGRGAAVCEGRGDQIERFACRSGLPCVIVKPPQGLSTPAVYGACQEADHGDRGAAAAAVRGLTTCDWRRPLVNALEPAALRVAPWLAELANLLRRLPVLAYRMTGSGSAFFALCRDFRSARRVAATARASRLGDIYLTATL